MVPGVDRHVRGVVLLADVLLGLDLAFADDHQAGADDPGVGHLLAEEAAEVGPVRCGLAAECH